MRLSPNQDLLASSLASTGAVQSAFAQFLLRRLVTVEPPTPRHTSSRSGLLRATDNRGQNTDSPNISDVCVLALIFPSATDVKSPPKFYRDVTEIGHYGTGDTEFTISSEQDFELVKPFIQIAYNKVGG